MTYLIGVSTKLDEGEVALMNVLGLVLARGSGLILLALLDHPPGRNPSSGRVSRSVDRFSGKPWFKHDDFSVTLFFTLIWQTYSFFSNFLMQKESIFRIKWKNWNQLWAQLHFRALGLKAWRQNSPKKRSFFRRITIFVSLQNELAFFSWQLLFLYQPRSSLKTSIHSGIEFD